PQYLLTAISLAEDRDLDIADELAEGRWRPFHALPLPEQTEPLADGRRLSPHDPLLPLLLAGPVAAGGWGGAKLGLAAVAGAAGRHGPVDRGAPPGRAGRHRHPGRRGLRLLPAPGRLRQPDLPRAPGGPGRAGRRGRPAVPGGPGPAGAPLVVRGLDAVRGRRPLRPRGAVGGRHRTGLPGPQSSAGRP